MSILRFDHKFFYKTQPWTTLLPEQLLHQSLELSLVHKHNPVMLQVYMFRPWDHSSSLLKGQHLLHLCKVFGEGTVSTCFNNSSLLEQGVNLSNFCSVTIPEQISWERRTNELWIKIFNFITFTTFKKFEYILLSFSMDISEMTQCKPVLWVLFL